MPTNLTFRKITDDDLDLLFASPDVKEALNGIFCDEESSTILDRQFAGDLVERGVYLAVVEETGEMIFSLGRYRGYDYNITPGYAYLYEGQICTMIETQGYDELSIYYCSESLRPKLPHVKALITQALIYGGDALMGGRVDNLPDKEKKEVLAITYTFIESNTLYFF